jgi:16S rRNA (guanine527-N7)-methyltransferase
VNRFIIGTVIPGRPDIKLQKQLAGGLEALGLLLPEAAQQALLDYLALLRRWNRRYNLTGIKDPADMVTRHLLDSLAVLPYLKGPRILDVGSGAGLPGIPLAVACPQYQFVLLDAAGKKTRFMLQAVADLGLKNVAVVRQRIEAFHPDAPFNTVVSRAFADINALLQLTAPLCHPQGIFLVMKGRYPEEELSLLPAAYTVLNVVALKVPGLAAARHAVIIGFAAAATA